MDFFTVSDRLKAATYFSNELAGGTTLAQVARGRIDFERGSFHVAMPDGADETNQGFGFSAGMLGLRGADAEDAFARVIKRFVKDSGCEVILQDTQARISHPFMTKCPYRNLATTFNEELYWRLADTALSEISDDEMATIVNWASFWPFSAFFYRNESIHAKAKSLSEADLLQVVDKLVAVAVGAFDDRSYLIWWRDDLRPFPGGSP